RRAPRKGYVMSRFAQMLDWLANELMGPVAIAMMVLGVVVTGYSWFVGGSQLGIRRGIQILVGGGIILAAREIASAIF
ncbi:MAG: TrbC/VirB2 family protein, partial [Thermoanaerobaculia bacterium]|nr:TrbC/VirB2 family protein [Thermoanaerobaculia bacterium]